MGLDTELSNTAKLHALVQLEKSQGWALFTELLENTKKTALAEVLKAENPHSMAINTGIYRSADKYSAWLGGMISLLKQAVEFKDL